MQIEILIHTPLPAVNICLSTEGCTCYVNTAEGISQITKYLFTDV